MTAPRKATEISTAIIEHPEQYGVDCLVLAAVREGIKEGITRYAVWNNGKLFVGVMRRPLSEVLAEIDRE